MRSHRRFVQCLLCCVALTIAVRALADDALKVDESITDVLTGGIDAQDYRVVVSCRGFEHVQCDAWAQWLSHDHEHGTRIAHFTPIKQLNGQGFVLGRLERSPVADSFVVMGNVTHTHLLSATGRFELRLGNPGRYEFRWLKQPSFAELEVDQPGRPTSR